jgi:hypothetical protein
MVEPTKSLAKKMSRRNGMIEVLLDVFVNPSDDLKSGKAATHLHHSKRSHFFLSYVVWGNARRKRLVCSSAHRCSDDATHQDATAAAARGGRPAVLGTFALLQ